MKNYTFKLAIVFSILFLSGKSIAQKINSKETEKSVTLDSVLIVGQKVMKEVTFLDEVDEVYIYGARKTVRLDLGRDQTGLEQNLARTIFAKIPNLTLWDMDGAGTQMNIGTRSTDAHRSIEMNMRQNGYNTNSDVFGYPENHFTVPMQAVKQIQFVRGAAALQFGPQFGGMINYVLHEGARDKAIAVRSEQTIGNYGFFNSFTSVGGTVGKFNYYAYYDYRHGDGWRDNAVYDYHSYHAKVGYKLGSKSNIAAEFSAMSYVQQIAGGLTEAQFEENPQQSFRSRNFFSPSIYIPAVTFNSRLSPKTNLKIQINGISGDRSSVQFIAAPTVFDTVNTSIKSYNPRQVDRDFYQGITSEARLAYSSTMGKMANTLAAGLRFSAETTKRRQKGVGTTGSEFDLSLTAPYGTDLRFTTHNYAAFIEDLLYLSPKFSVSPGIRIEIIQSDMSGVINKASDQIAFTKTRVFPLAGLGMELKTTANTQLYGNIAQAYRPFLYSNITPADRLDVIDPNLNDSKGYDADLGYRGTWSDFLTFDFNAFYLWFGNRIGLLNQQRADGSAYLLTTNIGNSVAQGIETYVELSLTKLFGLRSGKNELSVFNSFSFDDARYVSGQLRNAETNQNIKGNRVENTPRVIEKAGVRLQTNDFDTSLLYNYLGKSYNDALNTEFTTSGILGVIPAYQLLDWSFSWRINANYYAKATVNNLTNQHYFSRRITYYPGPGILPADGRTFHFSFGINI